jgi:hypothetical protein
MAINKEVIQGGQQRFAFRCPDVMGGLDVVQARSELQPVDGQLQVGQGGEGGGNGRCRTDLALAHLPPESARFPPIKKRPPAAQRPAPRSKRWFWEWRANLIRGQMSKRGSHSQMQTDNNESGSLRRSTSQQYGPVNADQLQAELERITERLADGPLYEVCLRVWACGEAAEAEVAGLSAALRSQLQGTWNELEVAEKGEDGAACR